MNFKFDVTYLSTNYNSWGYLNNLHGIGVQTPELSVIIHGDASASDSGDIYIYIYIRYYKKLLRSPWMELEH